MGTNSLCNLNKIGRSSSGAIKILRQNFGGGARGSFQMLIFAKKGEGGGLGIGCTYESTHEKDDWDRLPPVLSYLDILKQISPRGEIFNFFSFSIELDESFHYLKEKF